MPSSSASAPEKQTDWRDLLDQFELAWRSGSAPRLADYLAAPSADRQRLLQELILVDLEYRWRQATRPTQRLEDYLACYRELATAAEVSLILIGGEYRVRQLWGDKPAHDEYATRFPQHAARLRPILAEIDAQLGAEFIESDRVVAPLRPACAAAARPLPSLSVADILATLGSQGLVATPLLDSLLRDHPAGFPTPKLLAQALLQRNLLTAYQVNQVLLGRGPELVLGPYLLLERLGEGGMGQVFKARHQAMDRIVALKRVRRELLADDSVVRRFYQEIQLISRLTHPNIIHAYDAGPVGTSHALIMEFIEGIDLARLVKQAGPLSVERACAYVRQAAAALAYAHERGLVHRDIKPSNLLLVQSTDNIKLLDLGLARLYRNAEGQLTSTMTPEGPVTMGTVDFMAPEQALDFHSADIRADIYSLGCTFYYLLNGAAPYPVGSFAEKLLRHQQAEIPDPRQTRPDVPPHVAAILRRLLAKSPAKRYQTPAEVVDALAPDAAQRALRGARRRWLGRAGAAAVAAVGGWALWHAWKSGAAPVGSEEPVHAPLDRLQRSSIPTELLQDLPEAVVAAFGTPGKPPVRIKAALSPDGRLLAYTSQVGRGTPENVARLCDLAAGTERPLPHFDHAYSPVVFSPDGRWLLYGAKAVGTRWDVDLGQLAPPLYLAPQINNPDTLAFAPDSKLLAATRSGHGNSLRLYQVNDGKLLPGFDGEPERGVSSLCFSRDGTRLAACSYEAALVWDVASRKLVHRLGESCFRAAITADDATLATLPAYGNHLLLWDLRTGAAKGKIESRMTAINDFACARDGKLAAACRDNQRGSRLIVWDAARGKVVYETRVPAPVVQVFFATDSRHLITANEAGVVHIYRLSGPP